MQRKTTWNIAGILKVSTFYRFDVREMFEMPDGTPAQSGRLNTRAEKMVIEREKDWIILDLEELHEYIRRENKTRSVNDLISDLEWTIFMAKK